jgi:hypothetical protein
MYKLRTFLLLKWSCTSSLAKELRRIVMSKLVKMFQSGLSERENSIERNTINNHQLLIAFFLPLICASVGWGGISRVDKMSKRLKIVQ